MISWLEEISSKREEVTQGSQRQELRGHREEGGGVKPPLHKEEDGVAGRKQAKRIREIEDTLPKVVGISQVRYVFAYRCLLNLTGTEPTLQSAKLRKRPISTDITKSTREVV